uniref:Uncharacterized protein n=1 Tax=viral metagenome TaxID=1070528 RepID=A0A6C0I3X8_9ZZZZ
MSITEKKKILKEIYTKVHPHINVLGKEFEINKELDQEDIDKVKNLANQFRDLYKTDRIRHVDYDDHHVFTMDEPTFDQWLADTVVSKFYSKSANGENADQIISKIYYGEKGLVGHDVKVVRRTPLYQNNLIWNDPADYALGEITTYVDTLANPGKFSADAYDFFQHVDHKLNVVPINKVKAKVNRISKVLGGARVKKTRNKSKKDKKGARVKKTRNKSKKDKK